MEINFSVDGSIGNDTLTVSNWDETLTLQVCSTLNDGTVSNAVVSFTKKDAELVASIILQKARELKD